MAFGRSSAPAAPVASAARHVRNAFIQKPSAGANTWMQSQSWFPGFRSIKQALEQQQLPIIPRKWYTLYWWPLTISAPLDVPPARIVSALDLFLGHFLFLGLMIFLCSRQIGNTLKRPIAFLMIALYFYYPRYVRCETRIANVASGGFGMANMSVALFFILAKPVLDRRMAKKLGRGPEGESPNPKGKIRVTKGDLHRLLIRPFYLGFDEPADAPQRKRVSLIPRIIRFIISSFMADCIIFYLQVKYPHPALAMQTHLDYFTVSALLPFYLVAFSSAAYDGLIILCNIFRLSYIPEYWPELYNSPYPWTQRSIRRFWGVGWHQIFRHVWAPLMSALAITQIGQSINSKLEQPVQNGVNGTHGTPHKHVAASSKDDASSVRSRKSKATPAQEIAAASRASSGNGGGSAKVPPSGSASAAAPKRKQSLPILVILVFVFSGLCHDYMAWTSFPSHIFAPTVFFMMQGAAIQIETKLGLNNNAKVYWSENPLQALIGTLWVLLVFFVSIPFVMQWAMLGGIWLPSGPDGPDNSFIRQYYREYRYDQLPDLSSWQAFRQTL